MKSFFSGLPALLLASGLAFGLSACGDNGDNDPECTVTADCSGAEQCVEGECVIVDLCAEVTCPGAQTCNDETGACEGECCGPADCSGPTETCSEQKCLDGEANICDELTCPGDGPNQGCQEGFFCNLSSLECVAECQRDGCENPYAICDMTSGQCEDRAPENGEMGALCDPNGSGECASGLSCQQYGQCSKGCSADSDCPNGALCGPNGTCFDLCRAGQGDCAPDNQCVNAGEFFGQAPSQASICFPFFDESECTGDCLPNGAPCNPDAVDECDAGAACIQYGETAAEAVCQQVSCDVFGNHCDANEDCFGIGFGLTACFSGCDATDPTACSPEQGVSCLPDVSITDTFDGIYLTDPAVKDCAAGDSSQVFSVNGEDVTVCYPGCTTAADCGAGEICVETPVFDGVADTINTCTTYHVDQGSCGGGTCGEADCVDMTGQAAGNVICHETCTADADCTEAFGGSCTRLSFQSGDDISICTYDNTGSICFFGCEADADCGYCASDADCGVAELADGRQRQQRCDLRSNACVTPLNTAAEAGTWCRQGQDYRADAVLDAEGTTVTAGCGFPCSDDLDCAGTCGADGFCVPAVGTCNSATGQCEDLGCAVDTAADDCLHGTCAEGAGQLGENVCALACGTDQSCEAGTCDTDANICI